MLTRSRPCPREREREGESEREPEIKREKAREPHNPLADGVASLIMPPCAVLSLRYPVPVFERKRNEQGRKSARVRARVRERERERERGKREERGRETERAIERGESEREGGERETERDRPLIIPPCAVLPLHCPAASCLISDVCFEVSVLRCCQQVSGERFELLPISY